MADTSYDSELRLVLTKDAIPDMKHYVHHIPINALRNIPMQAILCVRGLLGTNSVSRHSLMSKDPETIRRLRKQTGLNQALLAANLGVSQGTISRWETGQLEIDDEALLKLQKLAGIYLGASRPNLRDIPVVGAAAYNVWTDTQKRPGGAWYSISILVPDEWMHLELSAYEVADTSANYHVNAGGFVVVAGFDENEILPRPGDIMIFTEEAEDGRFNTSIREYLNPPTIPDFDPPKDKVLLFNPTNDRMGWDLEISTESMEEAARQRSLEAAGFVGLVIGIFNVMASERIPPRKPPEENSLVLTRRTRRAPPPPPSKRVLE
ncbi:helix-turn-helix domain-containing protein [Bosea sp. NPDC055594]